MSARERQVMDLVVGTTCLVVVGWAAVDALGWLHGLGALAALRMLIPYEPQKVEP